MVNISKQGLEIVALCEKKVELMTRAEKLTEESNILLQRLQEISNEQYSLLHNMRSIELKIEYLAQSC